jgi:hypothetical protein
LSFCSFERYILIITLVHIVTKLRDFSFYGEFIYLQWQELLVVMHLLNSKLKGRCNGHIWCCNLLQLCLTFILNKRTMLYGMDATIFLWHVHTHINKHKDKDWLYCSNTLVLKKPAEFTPLQTKSSWLHLACNMPFYEMLMLLISVELFRL